MRVRSSVRLSGLLACSALLALGVGVAAEAQQVLVGVSPSAIQLQQNTQVTVPLYANTALAGGAALGSYQMRLSWDPAIVRFVSTSPGSFGVPIVNAANAAAGSLDLAGAAPAGATGVFTLAQLTFEMLTNTGSSPVAVGSTEFVAATTFAPLTATYVAGGFCSGSGTFGDVTGDATINGMDALVVVTAAVGLPITPYTLANADVDANGVVDTRDALIILSYAVGLPTPSFRVGMVAGACGGPLATTLALAPGALLLSPGDHLPLTPEARDAGGTLAVAPGLVWMSDLGTVATVDATGAVTALASGGPATITAMTVTGLTATSAVTVAPRHTWIVDAVTAAGAPAQLGSVVYPFSSIQQGLDAAGVGDTVFVKVGPVYGPATITKPVVLLGDSSTGTMPAIKSATGPALAVNGTGRVVIGRLRLIESAAGLSARGDTLVVRSLVADALRGPGIRAVRFQRADLTGVSATSVTLAGVLVDSTATVAITGLTVVGVTASGDSAAGVVVAHGASGTLSGITVSTLDGPGIMFENVQRATVGGFDVTRAGDGAVKVDSARYASLSAGLVHFLPSDHPAIGVSADTLVMDTVVVRGAAQGITFQARSGAFNPASVATITRSVVDSVSAGGGLIVDSIGQLVVSRATFDHLQGFGVVVLKGLSVRVDSTTIAHVGGSVFGAPAKAILPQFTLINAGAGLTAVVAQTLTMRGGHIRSAPGGAITVDSSVTVSLVGVEVDSSAIVPQTCFNCPALMGVRLAVADSVRLDSLNVHDNTGGGIAVYGARILVGTGSIVARNLGLGGPTGCEIECIIKESAPRVQRVTPLFTLGSVAPGVSVTTVKTTRLAHFTVDSNGVGGLLLDATDPSVTGASFTVDTSAFQGRGTTLLAASSDGTAQLTVRGSTFRRAAEGISGSSLGAVLVQGSLFDSVPNSGAYLKRAAEIDNSASVQMIGNTATNGSGYGFSFGSVPLVVFRNNLIQGLTPDAGGPYQPEAALEIYAADSAVVYGNQIVQNHVRGVYVYGGGAFTVSIDSNAFVDSSGYALQLERPTVVRRNRISGNYNGIFVNSGGETSIIRHNNFLGNVFSGLQNITGTPVVADSNYWNNVLGPRCLNGATGCDPGSLGDMVSGLVVFIPFLSSPEVGAP